MRALSASCPDRAMAGWGRRFRIAIQGEDPRTGRNFIWHMFQARPGGGASAAATVIRRSANGTPSAASNSAASKSPKCAFRSTSVSTNSARARPAMANIAAASASPLIWCWNREACEGQHRGRRRAPRCLRHARRRRREAAPLSAVVRGREPRVLSTKEIGIELRPGDCLEIRSSGGGGWGPPEKRSASARQRDREQGLIEWRSGVLTMYRIGVDVGGTYTDLVVTDESGRTVFAKSPSTPADQSIGVMAGLRRTGPAPERHARGDAGGNRSHGPWHNRCHQRAAGAQGSESRAAHHRRPSRRHRDA